ncbi:L-rhamnose mutarotase [Clostridioides sp. ES-S-0108-01]|uniref:L-rhamnose mutarotase n=1 Tax=Clostridioides sp. ES-S-0108-01 TaxID=2770773 RepID=UPI001D0C5A79|nr:L-rhamnose mutarotase [Clostridioides sp. ES-S-0108-01]UDN50926.1 L-rhamnose mutarotase [Clostridioides sp. ES-S-0107-01]
MNNTRKCFKMKLFKGFENEYKKHHDELWPEMIDMIHKYGGSNYSIFLDEETNYLYGYIELKDAKLWDKSVETAICKKWWAYMTDIMETNEDNSPVSIELQPMFYLK